MANEPERTDNALVKSYSRYRLYFSVFGVYTLHIVVGAYLGWTSPAIPKLKEMNVPSYKITLMASLGALAPGPLITIFGIDSIGRKRTLFVAWIIIVISWIIVCITEQIDFVLVARFIGGWGVATAYSAISIYISEISDIQSRGFLNSTSSFFIGIGMIITSSTGPFLSFSNYTIEMTILSLIFGIFYFFLPESPFYYVSKGNMDRARSEIVWLRKNYPQKEIDKELSDIQLIIDEEKQNKTGIRKFFSSIAVLKQFMFAFFILVFQHGCGISEIGSYSLDLFQSADLDFNAAYVTIILAVFMAVFGIPTPFLVKRFGNKKLFIVSGFGCAFSNCLLGVYFTLKEKYELEGLHFIPIVGVLLVYMFAAFGPTGIGWAVISDLFAPSVKGLATGILGIIGTLLTFVVLEIFGTIVSLYGYGPMFLGNGIFLLVVASGFFFTPNTTSMTLMEIQEYYEKPSGIKSMNNESQTC